MHDIVFLYKIVAPGTWSMKACEHAGEHNNYAYNHPSLLQKDNGLCLTLIRNVQTIYLVVDCIYSILHLRDPFTPILLFSRLAAQLHSLLPSMVLTVHYQLTLWRHLVLSGVL